MGILLFLGDRPACFVVDAGDAMTAVHHSLKICLMAFTACVTFQIASGQSTYPVNLPFFFFGFLSL